MIYQIVNKNEVQDSDMVKEAILRNQIFKALAPQIMIIINIVHLERNRVLAKEIVLDIADQ